jgi:hypothetical protein
MDALGIGTLGSLGLQGIGGIAGLISQRNAKIEQDRANRAAQATIGREYKQAQGYQQPYYDVGSKGLEQMQSGDYGTAVPGQPYMPAEYQQAAFNYQEDPGMAYRMQQGQRAISSSAAGAGTGLSGATLKALAKFGQNLGSQEYQNAYNRYSTDRNANLAGYQTNLGRAQDIWGQQKDIYGMGTEQQQQRYGRAQDLANYGQQAGTNLSNLASGYGENIAGLQGQQGQSRALGTMGMGQTWGSTLGNMANTGINYGMMKSLLK